MLKACCVPFHCTYASHVVSMGCRVGVWGRVCRNGEESNSRIFSSSSYIQPASTTQALAWRHRQCFDFAPMPARLDVGMVRFRPAAHVQLSALRPRKHASQSSRPPIAPHITRRVRPGPVGSTTFDLEDL